MTLAAITLADFGFQLGLSVAIAVLVTWLVLDDDKPRRRR